MKLVVYIAIIFFNIFLNNSPLNLVICVPQLLIVSYFLFKKDLKRAIFFHILFWVTSLSLYEGDIEGVVAPSYNYAKFKLIGSLSYSLLLNIIIFVHSFLQVPKISTNLRTLNFFKFYKFVRVIGFFGVVIGLFGLAFFSYYLTGFINYASYIFVVFINADILLRNFSPSFVDKLYNTSILLLVASPIATIVSLLFGVVNTGEEYDTLYSSSISYYTPLLILLVLQRKNIFLPVLGLVFFSLIVAYNVSGKSIVLMMVVLLATIFLANRRMVIKHFPVRSQIVNVSLLLIVISIPSFLLYVFQSDNVLLKSKLDSVLSLFAIFSFDLSLNNLAEIRNSPYIRVSSLINILYEHLNNPFTMIFGKGYGGFYKDHFNLFNYADLDHAFSYESVLKGEYYYAHDSLVTVPFLNGFIGVYYMIKVLKSYFRTIKYNFLSLACVPFLLLTFYFSSLIGVFGVMLLFSSESRRDSIYK